MIGLIASNAAIDAAPLVLAALRRSVSNAQARWISGALVEISSIDIIIAIEPDEEVAGRLFAWMARGQRKLILFGGLPPSLSACIGLCQSSWPADPVCWSSSPSALPNAFAQSLAAIHYSPKAALLGASGWRRPLERFDFRTEWNNLGFGAVRADGSLWSLAMAVGGASEHTLAEVVVDGTAVTAYSTLIDCETASILWYNRKVGPIDSFEWRLVERFLSSWRYGELPCQPVLQEIPWGYEAAVTMRLDCDEDVESAFALREAYHAMEIPFSLAVHTATLEDTRHHAILCAMAMAGESILSHSATHAPRWGGNYEAALYEARQSAAVLKSITGQHVRYAVSPFHQSPPYALAALCDAGYRGCVGGISSSDPEFLIARGGAVAGLPVGFIGHSQQHMLHGDCMLRSGDPLAVSKQAFERAFETRTLFGYLDHPFSARYKYGWDNEASRIGVHQALVRYIRSKSPRTIFLSQNDSLDFLFYKSEWQVRRQGDRFELQSPSEECCQSYSPTVEYANQLFPAYAGRIAR